MKVNQIIGEHKKGFRAKKYTKKTQHTIEPVKPKKPVGPGEEVTETVKVTAVDTSTGNVTYKDDVTGVETTVPKGMATPTAQGQVQISAQQVAPGEAGAAQAPVIKVGDQVDVIGQTGQTQTMGSMEETHGESKRVKAVKHMANKMAQEWDMPVEDFGQEELEYIGMIAQMGTSDIADILGLDSSEYGPVPSDDEFVDETEENVAPNEQPEDDPQMEAIKRLAGL